MGDIFRKAVENRRKKLINKLISFKVYQKEDKRLLDLTLTELENEYLRFQSQAHPHCNFESIQWNSKHSK